MAEKVRIVFVDDEPNVIRGLKRSLLSSDSEWDMVFCQSGDEALAAMEQHPPDIVVSDMRMPGMTGAELLDIVRKRYPDTIRVVLSGYSEQESVFRTVGPAHAYLAKPCDSQVLHDTLVRPLALRRLLHGNELRRLLGGLTHLPSVPDLFIELQAEIVSPRASVGVVAGIIGHDQAMTANILKLTNSAYFAVGAHITTPLEAVNLLGLELVQTLVLQMGIFRQFSGQPGLVPAVEAVNSYGQRLGHLAGTMATAAGAPPAEVQAARCAAMLSAIGCLVLLDNKAAEYEAVLAVIGSDLPLHVAEHAKFGTDHNLIGAYLLSLWGFSDLVVEAVAFACRPAACPSSNNPVLTVVHAARALGPPFPLLPAGIGEPPLLDMAYLVGARGDTNLRRWQELAAAEC